MKKTLSIIIPTYNMEKYLPRCLDSLILDDENMDKLEVLVINDGSKDSSSAIAHEYQKRYPSTFRVIDKENGNYGSCINRGIREAAGKYFKVLDADDWFDKEAFDKYLTFLSMQDTDLVLNNYKTVDEKGDVIKIFQIRDLQEGHIYKFEDLAKKELFFQMHSVAYKTKILRDMHYQQTEGISYTDMEYVMKPFSVVKDMVASGVYLYNYLVGREGQTVNPAITNKSFDQHCQVAISLIEFALNYKGENMRKQYLTSKALSYLYHLYRKHIFENFFDDKPFREFDSKIRRKYADIFRKANKYTRKVYVSIWKHDRTGFFTKLMKEIWGLNTKLRA